VAGALEGTAMPLTAALRFEVLQGLEKARQKVARGHPSLHAALHYLRLTARAWAEMDRALDDVRFEVPAEHLEAAALSEGGSSAEGLRLRDDLKAAQQNAGLPWESPEGHTRAQAVCLLFIAREFLRRMPVVGAGPRQPSLPLFDRSQS
jgi:hypothetical protein